MKVSVVIPTANRRDLLERVVNICLNQVEEIADAQVIVVDNSAAGDQAWIIEAVAAKRGKPAKDLEYVHEPAPGVASARNAGIRNAKGEYVAFIDDDEFPEPGWLAALVQCAEAHDADAVFGRVVPSFERWPRRHFRLTENLFTRDIGMPSGTDMSRRVHLAGTGNSCFRARTCFSDRASPFDVRFNQSGGEDTEFIRHLAVSGRKLVWSHEAVVHEFVPVDRASASYIASRRYSHGQMRTISHIASKPRRYDKMLFWMGVGATQYVMHSSAGMVLHVLGYAEAGEAQQIKARAGAGKVFWQDRHRPREYGLR